ncbi:hypothetical protein GIB67_018109 [Kingdonia uniflora]|uniref:Wall-associated receptor kinase galacturonan-binding domain-containing protein n=1 Tax=Kingdonia uniflora TaxID=39325 RepID=A0A7J7NWK8_9MAGN|nr:hypothetical protein GIB67_018109 [Kingdonia uniflora]
MQFQLLFLVGATLLLSLLQLCNSSGDCSESFKCVNGVYSYPFWGGGRRSYCGIAGFELICHQDSYTEIEINSQTYVVWNISEANQIMTIVTSDVWNLRSDCPSEFLNDTAVGNSYGRFEYVPGTLNYTLFYGCPFIVSYHSGESYCKDQINGTGNSLYLTADSSAPNKNTSECQGSILIPVHPSSVRGSSFWYCMGWI